jgi:hypothetical protein
MRRGRIPAKGAAPHADPSPRTRGTSYALANSDLADGQRCNSSCTRELEGKDVKNDIYQSIPDQTIEQLLSVGIIR